MRALPWILGTAALATAAYVVLSNRSFEREFDYDPIDADGQWASNWGTRQRISGAGQSLKGKFKEGLGNLTGDDDLAAEGLLDQAGGAVKDTAGAVANTLRDAVQPE